MRFIQPRLDLLAVSCFLLDIVFTSHEHIVLNGSLPWKDAKRTCEERYDGFAGNDVIDYQAVTESVYNQLQGSESAWINGVTLLSPFVSYIGCSFEIKAERHQRHFFGRKNSLYKCLDFCNITAETSEIFQYTHIGLTTTGCFCLDYDPGGISDETDCDGICGRYDPVRCGSGSYAAVYEISPVYSRDLKYLCGIDDNRKTQCVIAQFGLSEACAVTLQTTPCFQSRTLLDGYVCTSVSSFYSAFSRDCSAYFGGRIGSTYSGNNVCVFQEHVTLQEAREFCRDRRGILGNLDSLHGIEPLFDPRRVKYAWTGTFRTFATPDWSGNPSKITTDHACVTVTRVGQTLRLGTEDCTAPNKYVCIRRNDTGSLPTASVAVTKPEPTTARTTELTGNQFQGHSDVTPAASESDKEDSTKLVAMAIAIVEGVVIIAMATAVAYLVAKQRRKQTEVLTQVRPNISQDGTELEHYEELQNRTEQEQAYADVEHSEANYVNIGT